MDTAPATDTPMAGDARLGELDDIVGYHLRRAGAMIAADFTRVVGGTGLRQVLFGILSVVAANPGISQGAAGRALGIQRANMVGLINEAIEHGWIERSVSTDDRRAFALRLTGVGTRTLAAATRLIRVHEDELLGNLAADERRLLVDLLRRIIDGGQNRL